MKRALLVGREPDDPLGWEYVQEPPYDGVVIGSLSLSQQLQFGEEAVFAALAQGMPVELYTPGLADGGRNRALCAALASSRRQMKNYGILFTDGARKSLVTAEEARAMRRVGRYPAPGAVLTPLAKEILEGSD